MYMQTNSIPDGIYLLGEKDVMMVPTWYVAPLVTQALSHSRDVLLVSSLGQAEDHLHQVSVLETGVSTLHRL